MRFADWYGVIPLNPIVCRAGQTDKKIRQRYAAGSLLVDANGLEPLTLRTSSECSTS